jgi:hypothetical protein
LPRSGGILLDVFAGMTARRRKPDGDEGKGNDDAGDRADQETREEHAMTIKITPNDKGNPPGKLADAELHFADGPLAGLKLIGFSVWERRAGNGRNVTFPARTYAVNGERRSFSLLRPILDTVGQNKLREMIIEAYQEYEQSAAIAL